jgi:dTMP kinase
MPPIFITFEGVDGSGKTTICKKVAAHLKREGHTITVTKEPTDTWLGEAVRRSYRSKTSPYTEAFLFMADRATHTDWVKGRMSKGRHVFCDRYSDSTVAYQAALLHRELGGPMKKYREWLLELNEDIILKPNLTLLFDVDPNVSLKRLKGRAERTKFERLKYLQNVRENYLAIAEGSRHVKVIDASQPYKEVYFRTLNTIKKKL